MPSTRSGLPRKVREKNPVGVGETYGARREETLRNNVTLYVLVWFRSYLISFWEATPPAPHSAKFLGPCWKLIPIAFPASC